MSVTSGADHLSFTYSAQMIAKVFTFVLAGAPSSMSKGTAAVGMVSATTFGRGPSSKVIIVVVYHPETVGCMVFESK